MPYTLWSNDQLLGESDFEMRPGPGLRRAGVFRPTPLGATLLPTLTGLGPALLELGQTLSRSPVGDPSPADQDDALDAEPLDDEESDAEDGERLLQTLRDISLTPREMMYRDRVRREFDRLTMAANPADASSAALDDPVDFDDSADFEGFEEFEEFVDDDDIPPEEVAAFEEVLSQSESGAEVRSFAVQLAALELELRDPAGAVVPTHAIAVHDLDRLLAFVDAAREAAKRESEAISGADGRPRYFMSATFAEPRATRGRPVS